MAEELSKLEDIERQIAAAKRQKLALECKTDFLKFIKFTMPTIADPNNIEESMFKDARHHRAIALALEKVAKGKIKRLIVTLPPRHGKSEMVSRRFIPWLMGKDPYKSIIFATYNEDFGQDFGADCRSIMSMSQFSQVFPKFTFRQGGASKSRIQTDNGGMAVFVGRGGSITGRGGDCLIVDDPIKDSVEAQSPTLRENLWSWFTQVFMTRLMTERSTVVLVTTRWHEDDLVGRLTDPTNPHFTEAECSKWKIINLPALAGDNDPLKRKEGEVLWPERFNKDFLEAQRNLDPRGFSALYQQQPSPEDGDLFQRENIQYYEKRNLPKNLRIYAASDHAVGIDKTRHDLTCLLIVGVDENEDIYLIDCWWARQPSDVVVKAMMELMNRHKPLIWWAERGHITKAIGPFLRKRMFETKTHCRIEEVTPVANKVQRSQSLIGRMAMKKVYFPKVSAWGQKAIDELLKFPNARHDDFVDTLSWIGMGLGQLHSPGGRLKATGGLFPKVGTIEWVKWQTTMDSLEQKKFASGF
jgi:predicted phage terminase large subunit-like protein